MKKLYAIFVNYNSGDQLVNGVGKVITSPAVHGVVVVDNGSKDNSLSKLSRLRTSKKIVVKRNNKNLGFYKALNIAVKKAIGDGADRVMPLDFDLDFSFDFIDRLSKVKADMVAPALTSKMDNKWFFDYGGRVNYLLGNCYHNIKYKESKKIGTIMAGRNLNNSNWFDFISGGCTIINKEVFEKCGYFDEDYFVYFGDAEYAIRANKNGFKVAMDGNTIVHHKLEITSQSRNFKKMKIALFDNLTFIRKKIEWYNKPASYVYLFSSVIKVLLKTYA